jgi:hypothetical protein
MIAGEWLLLLVRLMNLLKGVSKATESRLLPVVPSRGSAACQPCEFHEWRLRVRGRGWANNFAQKVSPHQPDHVSRQRRLFWHQQPDSLVGALSEACVCGRGRACRAKSGMSASVIGLTPYAMALRYLNNNQLTSVPSGVFSGLTRLTTL